ncbi:FAD dependent oxidoreductase [Favolaschia claudopus]|uniref:FAD dependent oxidoreductase n=1 Tax=Favolaschia claudopus TaxID=2862362 RepID=A0AAV9ZC76_9AGAR
MQEMSSTPGFPRPKACFSFWLQHTQNSPLLGHRTTETLPVKSDITIIGSGLSGVATAYFLLTSGPEDNRPSSVTLLEAREPCDGATARNGGNCRPNCYRYYEHYKAQVGRDQALKIFQNEMDTLNLTTEIIAKEGIDCDFQRGYTFDTAMDRASADELAASYAAFTADGGPVDGIVTPILDPTEARAETRCPSVIAAYKFPASSLFPRKLVLHLLTLCIEKHGLNFQTNTPVRRVVRAGEGWRVETDRGAVETRKVVYATNAFTATLLLEYIGRIFPFKGQCAAVVPPSAYAGNRMLRNTSALGDGEYIMQRPADGIMIFGGQRRSVPVERLLGNTDDASTVPEMSKALKDSLPRYFEEFREENLAEGEGMVHVWSGIMGYTTEGIPYVGELHDKPGAFICAGHHGHGMARIMTCARGLARLIQGGSWEATGLPECFQPTRERLALPPKAVVHHTGQPDVAIGEGQD